MLSSQALSSLPKLGITHQIEIIKYFFSFESMKETNHHKVVNQKL